MLQQSPWLFYHVLIWLLYNKKKIHWTITIEIFRWQTLANLLLIGTEGNFNPIPATFVLWGVLNRLIGWFILYTLFQQYFNHTGGGVRWFLAITKLFISSKQISLRLLPTSWKKHFQISNFESFKNIQSFKIVMFLPVGVVVASVDVCCCVLLLLHRSDVQQEASLLALHT